MSTLYTPIQLTVGPKGKWLEYKALIPTKRVDPFIALLFMDNHKIYGQKKVAEIIRRLRSNPSTIDNILQAQIHGLFAEHPPTVPVSLHNLDGITHMMLALSGTGFVYKLKCFFRKHLKINEELKPLFSKFFLPVDVNGHTLADEIAMVGQQVPPGLRNWLGLYDLENIAIELQNIKINPKGRIPALYTQVFGDNGFSRHVGYKENKNSTNHGGGGGGGSPKNGRVAEINRQVRELKRVGKMSR